MGRHSSIVWGIELSNKKLINMKYTTALNSVDQEWLIQQPTKNRQPRQREVWREDATSGTPGGSVILSFWGCCKLNNLYKL